MSDPEDRSTWSARDHHREAFCNRVAQKLATNATTFSAEEIEMVDDIARVAKHRWLLGETRFSRAEIRACGAQRRAIR